VATIVTTLPQTTTPIHTVTIREVVDVLPKTLPWPITVWVGDRLARFGRTTESITFLAEMDNEPTVEQRTFFEGLIAPLGLPATLIEDWKNQRYSAIRLYNEGKLIVDKDTMTYTELPTPVYEPPVLTVEEAVKLLPKEVPWKDKIWLTGGLVKNGWTANDFDFIAETDDQVRLREMAMWFTKETGWKTHVGLEVMKDKEPVFMYLCYEEGQLL
jgi:hypothetical protein